MQTATPTNDAFDLGYRGIMLMTTRLAASAVAILFLQAPIPATACVGDCDGDGRVTVAELVRGVRIGLNGALPQQCVAIDDNHDTVVSIGELIAAVRRALDACPVPTVTPSPTATPIHAPCNPTPLGAAGNASVPSVAVAANGRFAAAWIEVAFVDPPGFAKTTLRLQRFAANGTPTRVVQDIAEYAGEAALAYTNGTVLLVVGTGGVTSLDGSVTSRQLDAYWRVADGSEPRPRVTLLGPFQQFFRDVDVAADARGGFVVGLSHLEVPFISRSAAYRFDENGRPQPYVPLDSRCIDSTTVAMAPSGRFVVACIARVGTLPHGSPVFAGLAQRFDADGARLGDPIEVFDRPDSRGDAFDVAMDADANFAFVWNELSASSVPTNTILHVRHFYADGTPRADWSAEVPGIGIGPQLAMGADGSAVAILPRPLLAWRFNSEAELALGPLGLVDGEVYVVTAAVGIDADRDAVVAFATEDGNSYVRRIPSGTRCGTGRAASSTDDGFVNAAR